MSYKLQYRALDLVISLSLFPVCLILITFLSLLTILIDRENPFFTQARVGQHKKRFTIYKMRTFKRNAPECASHEVDPCMLLRVGKMYRATRLDELPQLLNVILGDMSLVGPRPCLPSQLQLIELRTKASIFDVKPGITGLSQCLGIDMRDPYILVGYDQKMLKEMSFPMYIKILHQTLRFFS